MEYSLSEWLILSPNFPTWWHTEHLPVSGSFLQRRRGTHRWNYIYQNVCTDAASNEQAAAIYCAVTAIWKELLFVDEVCVKAGSDGFESLASWCITNNIEMEKFDLKSIRLYIRSNLVLIIRSLIRIHYTIFYSTYFRMCFGKTERQTYLINSLLFTSNSQSWSSIFHTFLNLIIYFQHRQIILS